MLKILKPWMRYLLLGISLLLAVFFAWWFFSFVAHVHGCYENYYQAAPKTANEDGSVFFGCLIRNCPIFSIQSALLFIGAHIDAVSAFVTALATVLIATFTGVLYKATNKQAKLTRESIDLARQEYVSTHRPKIRVRNIVAHTYRTGELFGERGAVGGQFYVQNVGDTVAHITAHGCWVEKVWRGLPMERPYEGKNPVGPVYYSLAPGESAPILFQGEPIKVPTVRSAIANSYSSEPWQLFVMGYVEYFDDIGTFRRTAFCRRYDSTKCRFVKEDDPDYEYEE